MILLRKRWKYAFSNSGTLLGLLVLALLLLQVTSIAFGQPMTNADPSKIVFTAETVEVTGASAQSGRILIYADDYVLAASEQYSVKALDALGYSYTLVYYDPLAFYNQLTTGGPWEKVIIDQNTRSFGNYYGIGHPIWDDVNNYILGGGRAVIVAWDIDVFAGHPLWATLGASWSSVSFDPLNVYAWNPSHPTLVGANLPWTTWSHDYIRDAQLMNPTIDGVAVAGFTATAQADQAAIIVRTDGKTVLSSFLICEHRVPAEAIALWKNMISFVQRPAAVGGYAVPVNKLNILAPYLALLGLVGVVTAAVAATKKRKP